MLTISHYSELIALLRAVVAAKFNEDPTDTDVPVSSSLAALAVRIRDALVAEDVRREGSEAERRWRDWIRLDSTRDEWRHARSFAARALRGAWPSWTVEERKEVVAMLLSPFDPGEEGIEQFVRELESLWV